MTAKKPTPKPAQPSGLYRLAEIMQMRRNERVIRTFGTPGTVAYFECLLCLGRSDDANTQTEIKHSDDCPITKLKDTSL